MGLKLPVTPDGKPDAVKATAALKPPETAVVTVTCPLLLSSMDIEVGETEMVNAGGGKAVTVNETLVVCVTPPPIPVIVIEYVPATVFVATVKVTLDVPEPGAAMGVGLNPTVTPVGWPLADKATAESKPSIAVVVMVEATAAALYHGDRSSARRRW